MKIEQIYTGCLAQGAYYIESEGEVAIIDPLREVQPYLDRAEAAEANIKYIFETHFHADFVSGHLDLAKKSGATIVYGPTAKTGFESHTAKDGEVFKLGKLTITALHTPGHTMESTTYLLKDEFGNNHAIFSGDTLFLGDVGRPDLAQKAADMTQEELAGMLFDSLRNKIMPLEDSLIVYPGHGAGSACGKNMMKETVDTLGNQKNMNYALRADMGRDEFIKEVTDGLAPPPAYFPENVAMNKMGYESIDSVIKHGMHALSAAAFEAAAEETEALVLDTREPQTFAKGFVPGSINIGLKGQFAPWVGALIPGVKHPLLLVTDKDNEQETIMRLARVGYDNVIGFLDGGIAAWEAANKDVDVVRSIDVTEFEEVLHQNPKAKVIDVRKEGEYVAEHVDGAVNLPLDFINDLMAEFPKEETMFIHCQGGYRSMIAASILKARGYHHLVDVAGGYAAIKKNSAITCTDYVCPTTLKK
jgi:glyoxylase-like metal-dependent hydrolase (beta-lactamase superfamily II)/rhodanese-related sulfurtransferase